MIGHLTNRNVVFDHRAHILSLNSCRMSRHSCHSVVAEFNASSSLKNSEFAQVRAGDSFCRTSQTLCERIDRRFKIDPQALASQRTRYTYIIQAKLYFLREGKFTPNSQTRVWGRQSSPFSSILGWAVTHSPRHIWYRSSHDFFSVRAPPVH